MSGPLEKKKKKSHFLVYCAYELTENKKHHIMQEMGSLKKAYQLKPENYNQQKQFCQFSKSHPFKVIVNLSVS